MQRKLRLNCNVLARKRGGDLEIQPRVKSLGSSYTGLYPQIRSSYTGLYRQRRRTWSSSGIMRTESTARRSNVFVTCRNSKEFNLRILVIRRDRLATLQDGHVRLRVLDKYRKFVLSTSHKHCRSRLCGIIRSESDARRSNAFVTCAGRKQSRPVARPRLVPEVCTGHVPCVL